VLNFSSLKSALTNKHSASWLAALSGVLYALANVGYGVWPLALVCFVPFILALESKQHSLFRAWRLSVIAGCSIYVLGFPFLLSLAEGFIAANGAMVCLLWLFYGLVFTLSFSIFGGAYWLCRRLGFSVLIATPMAVVCAESLQFNLFPSYLGASLVHSMFLAQAADLGGVYLLSGALALVNAGAYVFWHKKAQAGAVSLASTFAIFGVIGSLWLYGFARHLEFASGHDVATPEAQQATQLTAQLATQQAKTEGQGFSVGVIQSNLVGLELDELSRTTLDEHIEQSKALLERQKVDLLVWPESSYVRGLRQPLPLDAGLLRRDLDVPIIFGGTSVFQQNGRRVSGNANFLIGEDGMIRHAYTKRRLIPFAEYLPFAEWSEGYRRTIKAWFPRHNEFTPGQSFEALVLSGTRISTPICYEMIYPDYVQQMVAYANPNILLTLANDSWFAGSQEPQIHLALVRLRAIEHRRWVIRAANSGISAIISPTGTLVSMTEQGVQASLIGEVMPRSDVTLYSRYGNWMLYAVLSALTARLFWLATRRITTRIRLRFV
jgi:apolipoprotein N-acyltransferase